MKDNNYKYRLLVKIFLFAYLVFFGDFFAYGQGVFGGKIAILDNAGSTTWWNTNSQTCDGAGTGNLSNANATAYSCFQGDRFYLGGNVLTWGFNTNYGAFMQWRYYLVGSGAPSWGTALNFSSGSFTSGVCSSGTNIKIERLPDNSSSNYIQCTNTGNYRLDVLLSGYNNSVNYNQYTSGNYIPFTVNPLNTPVSATATAVSGSQIDLGWSKDAQNHNVMIVRSTTNTFTAPTQGTAYSVGATIGSGTVIYNSNGTAFSDTGLTCNTTYYYAFYSENYYLANPAFTALSNESLPEGVSHAPSPYSFHA